MSAGLDGANVTFKAAGVGPIAAAARCGGWLGVAGILKRLFINGREGISKGRGNDVVRVSFAFSSCFLTGG